MTTFTKICRIYSAVTEMPDAAGITEGGYYEMEVKASLSEAAASGDARGFLQKEVARHLAGCVAESGIPLGEMMWRIEFTNFICINFGFPEGTVVA
jgi:hypothetical protein